MRTLRHWTGLLLCGLALAAAAAPPACPPPTPLPDAQLMQAALRDGRDRGFLWRFSDADGRSSWLYGTLHVGKPAWMLPGPRTRAALQGTGVLALEIDVTDPSLRERLERGGRDTKPWTPAPAMQARLEQQIAATCLPATLFSGQHPLLQLTTLTVLAGRWDGLDPSFGQEVVLASLARATGQPIVSLETPELQMRVLLDTDEAEGRRLAGQMLEQLEAGDTRGMLRRMAGVWERGDLAELERYEQWCDCAETADDRAMLKRLNDDRNPALADAIERLHRGGRSVFAAVGALHMTGPQALPALLAARGFKVERIAPVP